MESHRVQSKITTDPQPTSSFPIVAISLVGIILTGTFLLIYYIFVINCYLNPDAIQRLSRSRRRLPYHSTRNRALPSSHTGARDQGLRKSVIEANIPVLRFKSCNPSQNNECSVCLYEFQEEEKIRMLPGCFHVFHIDCIDAWLQTHSNCPICRAAVACTGDSIRSMHGSDDAVVVDVGGECGGTDKKKVKEGLSFGDECIDLGGRGEEFAVVAIRRSFSLGSISDRRLYATVQEIMMQNPHFRRNLNGEGTSVSSVRN